LHGTEPAGGRWSPAASKGKKDSCPQAVLTNKEGLGEDVKVGGSRGCSDHEMMNLRILRGGSRAISRIKTLDFSLFKELLGGILWVRAVEGRGFQESWSLF